MGELVETEYVCRVCGLVQPDPAWEDGFGSFDICACCGTEFGYQDTMPEGVRAVREDWRARGYPWADPKRRPVDWDVRAQLANIPARWR
ncbi:hypothetical protein JOF53_008347 [Crossiella equi]|uniref:Cysteine-rich CPCC domain-containing protein n=1 Tax=Crossiella equi TaxID=130796 RepID=A0ABS5ASD0_9PSEU|nr:hypothetical protein [Crossiella equi]MBP2479475.1 hypothetical protein [Crossiella equi]